MSTVKATSVVTCKIKHIPLKRIFDILFSSLVMCLFSPFFLLIAFFIKISSPGKVFFSHLRVGRGGRKFRCYKFRTMYPNAEERLKEILDGNPEKLREWTQTQKLKNDPRVTPIGKILRKTSFDEFPQFWNVFKGDLSVVGPRPVVESEIIDHFGLKAEKILSIRPGITGIWQVSGRSDTCYQTRILLDEKYVDQRSMLFDLILIIKTIPSVVLFKGAY